MIITSHAIERYQERVANVSDDEARLALASPAVRAAALFGCKYVRLATGQRIVVEDGIVKTVLPSENYRKQVRRLGRARFGGE